MRLKRFLTNSLLPLFLLIFLFPRFAVTQPGTEDVIYLKNGSIIHGEIIERVGKESLKIKTECRNVIVVRLEEVKEIKREKISIPVYYKESGYVNQTGIDVLPGKNEVSVRFQMINGYQFTPRISAGIGIGFILYNDPLNLVPLYLDFKYKFMKANTTPFVFFRSGYSFSILADEDSPIDEHNGGFMINPGIGLHFDTKSGYGWYINAGYNLDNSSFEQEIFDGRVFKEEISYRRLQFGFGLSF